MNDKILKGSHKNLMILEAGYIFCKRHNINYDTFIDDVFMKEEFNSSEGSEFDNICRDLRSYKRIRTYSLLEITDDEYNYVVDKFGFE